MRPIVTACDGRLIYAGGDDVLALVPADTVLECAAIPAPGLLWKTGVHNAIGANGEKAPCVACRGGATSSPWPHRTDCFRLLENLAAGKVFRELEGRVALGDSSFALNLPGELDGHNEGGKVIHPDASVGIAMAHFKNPLQDVIREAQTAEKRAKRGLADGGLDRSAMAVTLLKRSGETVEWGCKWDSGGPDVFEAVHSAIRERAVSARFPHCVCELAQAYLTETSPSAAECIEPLAEFPVVEVLLREFCHELDRRFKTRKTGILSPGKHGNTPRSREEDR